ncbi:hypothetical protein [Fodinibius sp. Rm-B-1B1-1]|uniref:hypothetical protein n=1 Tax=Fodinibius alkaliphilus TaxID=3140241 RepID=UPI00315A642D
MNQFHKDEANIELLRERFDERAQYVEKLSAVTEDFDASTLSSAEKKRLNSLFERFEDQQRNIQEALDYILAESKERLDNAIKSNKAEQSYRILNR